MTETLPSTAHEISETYSTDAITTDPEGGPIVGVRRWGIYSRGWKLVWTMLTKTEMTALDNIHAATRGGTFGMLWTPPHETKAVRVRFLPGTDGYLRTRPNAYLYTLEAAVIELREYRPRT